MFQLPYQTGFTIYSKNDCPYCIKAKKVLDNDNLKYLIIYCDQYLIENRHSFIEFMSQYTNQKTFPYIFYNGTFIGGFTELVQHLTFMEDD